MTDINYITELRLEDDGPALDLFSFTSTFIDEYKYYEQDIYSSVIGRMREPMIVAAPKFSTMYSHTLVRVEGSLHVDSKQGKELMHSLRKGGAIIGNDDHNTKVMLHIKEVWIENLIMKFEATTSFVKESLREKRPTAAPDQQQSV